ncbi:hypothetical protein ACIGXM_35380 [Kitasatospora sp. NPDC052896]|uniref:hypothetical protein n=1 Tax=Kitasatospora sp. NPDC052896 TaxID=3364061 RepID=UPI0037CA0917
MSRRRSRPTRRSPRPPYAGMLPWLLGLPARLHVRWLLIATVMTLAMGAYLHVLLTAPPMPPEQAPNSGPGVAQAAPAPH